MKKSKRLLSVKGLKTYFYTDEGIVRAVDGVNFEINRGEIFGLVGESGCGKSVTALSIMKLIPSPIGKIVEGEIIFEGENLVEKDEERMRRIRGRKISMIFQDPHSSLNPVFTIGDQIGEAIKVHENLDDKQVPKEVIKALESVKIPDPEERMHQYPHQFSGGMKQRAMIAMMIRKPSLLIADEPTTALDVTIQIQILELMKEIRKKLGTSIMLITHNLGVVAETCDRAGVMYVGKIVELADIKSLFKDPKHPYTLALLSALPSAEKKRGELPTIPGVVPSAINPPPGCRFHPRCIYAMDICRRVEPREIYLHGGRMVRCHLYDGRGKG
jgi:oligopeptide/dipeptide ABC transporter ATP-binding protein